MKNDINEIGRDVIDLQIKALKKLKNSINDTFGEAVQKILKCGLNLLNVSAPKEM